MFPSPSASWQRIEAWLRNHAPDILADLGPPASPERIRAAEEQLQCTLPEDVRASLGIHDGQQGSAAYLFGQWEYFGIEAVLSEHKMLQQVFAAGAQTSEVSDPRVRKAWWLPAWIPILGNGSGDYYCIDLNPEPSGSVGQLIEYLHTHEYRRVLATSFTEWLAQFAKDFDDGRFARSEAGWLIRVR
jgi:cell wall assembly regulator SMI1